MIILASTWGMMILGFFGVGFVAYDRKVGAPFFLPNSPQPECHNGLENLETLSALLTGRSNSVDLSSSVDLSKVVPEAINFWLWN
jgi:hypothetical protein